MNKKREMKEQRVQRTKGKSRLETISYFFLYSTGVAGSGHDDDDDVNGDDDDESDEDGAAGDITERC